MEEVQRLMQIPTLDLPSSPELVNNIIEGKPTRDEHLWEGEGMTTTVGNIRVDGNIIRFDALSHNTVRGAAGGVILLAELQSMNPHHQIVDHYSLFGGRMGVTAMIPNMTFQQLKDEADSRWQEIWDGNAARLEVLLLSSQRKKVVGTSWRYDRPRTTRHGIFHRPRAEAELISEQGFDPKCCIFPIHEHLMQTWDHGCSLVTQEGWLRSTVEITCSFYLDIPTKDHSKSTLFFVLDTRACHRLRGTSCLIQSTHWLAKHSYHYLAGRLQN